MWKMKILLIHKQLSPKLNNFVFYFKHLFIPQTYFLYQHYTNIQLTNNNKNNIIKKYTN